MVREDSVDYKAQLGSKYLSDREVLASLFISYGEDIAIKLAQDLISKHKTLKTIFSLNRSELVNIGLTEKQATILKGAASIRQRINMSDNVKGNKIVQSRDCYNLLLPYFENLPHEEFWIVIISQSGTVLKTVQISSGGVTGTVVDAKLIFKAVIATPKATTVMLAHNHPSGNKRPSEADKNLTKKLVDAGKTLDIKVLDHIIVTDDSYYSFADEGIL